MADVSSPAVRPAHRHAHDTLVVRGAREHNLKNLSVELPRDSLIVFTGLSGAVVPPEILNTQQSDQFSWVVVGVILMLLVIFRPQGILGNKRELQFNA